jgi:hypothetical protein
MFMFFQGIVLCSVKIIVIGDICVLHFSCLVLHSILLNIFKEIKYQPITIYHTLTKYLKKAYKVHLSCSFNFLSVSGMRSTELQED